MGIVQQGGIQNHIRAPGSWYWWQWHAIKSWELASQSWVSLSLSVCLLFINTHCMYRWTSNYVGWNPVELVLCIYLLDSFYLATKSLSNTLCSFVRCTNDSSFILFQQKDLSLLLLWLANAQWSWHTTQWQLWISEIVTDLLQDISFLSPHLQTSKNMLLQTKSRTVTSWRGLPSNHLFVAPLQIDGNSSIRSENSGSAVCCSTF